MDNAQAPEKKPPNTRLQHERELKGWSQEYVAKKIGTTAKNVSRWERGDNKPVPYYRKKLCKLFGKNAEDLGFLDQELIDEAADGPHESPLIQHTTSVDLDEHHSFQIIVPTTVSLVTIQLHQQLPLSSGSYSHGNGIIFYRGTQSIIGQRNLEEMPQGQNGKISRRETFGLLAAMPFLSFTQIAHVLHDEEILAICATNIPILWRLYFEGSRSAVAHVLPEYTSQLSMLAQQPSHYQVRAASLASQAYQLASSLSLHRQDFGTALDHARRALFYAEQVGDYHLQTASFIRQAMILLDLNRIGPRLEAYEHALLYSENTSPLLRSRVYLGLAEAYSKIGHVQDAQRYIGLARDNFPDHPENDPNFAYTHFDHWSLREYTGLMHLNLEQASSAWESFSKAENIIPNTLVAKRVRFFTTQTTASFAMGNLDVCHTNVEAAATSAQAIGSHLRYNEAYNIYLQMLKRWPYEQKVKQLEGLFRGLGQEPF